MNFDFRILFSVLSFSLFSSLLLANPSTKTPEALLKIRPGEKINGDYLATDYEAISQRYAKAKSTSDDLWAKHEAKKLARGDGAKIGPQALLINELRRDADFLQLRGEACGWDLGIRVAELDSRLSTVVRQLVTLPGLNLTPLQQQLEKAHAAGMKRLPQIEMLITQKKFVQAEGELYEILDDMTRSAVWFPTTDNSSLFKPFMVPIEQARQLRRDQAVAELQTKIDSAPDLAKLQAELTQAAVEIGGSGRAMWEGKMVTGPELLTAWQTNWPKLQAATKRALMAQWTIEQITTVEANYVGRVAAQQQFAQAVPAALAAIIQADAQRTPTAEAATLYPAYVTAAATLCAVGPRQELESAFAPALKALAAKAGLEKDVDAYRTAMEPLLGWKRFLARAQAKSLAAGSKPVHDWCTKSLGTSSPPHTIINPQTDIGRVQVISSVDLVLPAVIPAGSPPTIVVSDVVPASATAQRWVARYQQRVFAVVAAPPPAALQAAASQLEQQLLVTPQLAPPSLDAATALAGARLGVFEKVGGPVEQVVVEPLLTRFVTLTDEAGTLLPLGAMPAEAFDPSQTNEQGKFLSIRCDVMQPKWLQNECFVIQP